MKQSRGFSIIELMMAVTVLGILLALAIPSFRETIRNNQMVARVNELVGALNYARNEATKRGSVSVCPSSDGMDCSGDTDWAGGWIVFDDVDGDGDRDGAEDVLQIYPALDAEFELSSTERAFVRYLSTGKSTGRETFALFRTGCTGDHARQVEIDTTGRIASSVSACP